MTIALNCETATCTDIGARYEQEDRVAVIKSLHSILLVVADGMGGHEGGTLAAQTVIDTARQQFEARGDSTPLDLLRCIVANSHKRINDIGEQRRISPHSTCVLLFLDGNEAAWAHVGDSRLYRFDGGRLIGRTIDHSVVELMRLQGRISEEEMKTHPDQNRLYEALGSGSDPDPDTGSAKAAESDGFLLASDGLWENTADAELEALFQAPDLADALQDLVGRARVRGGPACDNISAIAARRSRSKHSNMTSAPWFLGI